MTAIENRATPPNAHIEGARRPPNQVITAVKLAVLNQLLGYVVFALTWSYYASQMPLRIMVPSQIVGLILAVWIYYKTYVGRNWARIVLLVVVGLSLIMVLVRAVSGQMTDAPLISRGYTFISVAINLFILWLLFISPGRDWFRKKASPGVA